MNYRWKTIVRQSIACDKSFDNLLLINGLVIHSITLIILILIYCHLNDREIIIEKDHWKIIPLVGDILAKSLKNIYIIFILK